MRTQSVDLAVILAGGLSRRMGQDKATVSLAGKPLVGHVIDRLLPQARTLAINAPAPLDLPYRMLPDTRSDRPGPLAGILAAMRESARCGLPHVLTVPVDTPFLPTDLSERLGAKAAPGCIAVASSAGRSHPVVALWPSALAEDLELWLADPQNRKVTTFQARHPSIVVEFPLREDPARPLDPFFNVNNADDLARAEQIVEAGGWD
ncbi:molybdenum cofactor guanylyltransferase MobA [Ciceribacter sp. L1K22]|uniref:molybdenum cofactor guanylyltransferase MobA n=1 Tax=Ciceribacter sp. L1K22 TaxID=2820275 RepID=UPI001ABE250E|nr:molybdenum cofactor guanylyltransferase MobA [Ciceribacter sp. L1K22]MBO3760709.1 molybdenum cofactor guanylyltransferase [Ciceribacter sp. L1K22]